jgi:TolB protein
LLFTSQGKTGIANLEDGSVHYLNLNMPNQVTWQPGPAFPDGERIILLSMEPRRDGPGKPFDEYYTQTPTHIWSYHLDSGMLSELCTRDRMAPFVTPALLIGDERLLVQVVKDRVGQIMSVRLDGSDPRPFTEAGEGLPYGLSLSPDKKRVAYHLASPEGYQVWTADVDGGNRVRVAADPAHLYFGTAWSPDGNSVVYADCHYHSDPGHDWADVCVGRADGSQHRVLTTNQAMWFAATYGNEKTRGGGSNVPGFTPDGAVLFPRRSPGAQVPWQYRAGQPDLDHFNRAYKPREAKGGSQIVRLDPASGAMTELTPAADGIWDFRSSVSTDGKHLVFCRTATGEGPGIWVADADGSDAKLLTRGVDDLGADHPRWV